jgi:hypothetical protein
MLQYLNLSQQGDLHTINAHSLRTNSVLSDFADYEAGCRAQKRLDRDVVTGSLHTQVAQNATVENRCACSARADAHQPQGALTSRTELTWTRASVTIPSSH